MNRKLSAGFGLLMLLFVWCWGAVSLIEDATAAAAPIQGYQDQATCVNQDTVPIAGLQAHNATVMRVGFSAVRAGQGLDCIKQAHDAGYKIYLSLDGGTPDPAAEVAFFQHWLPIYEQAAPIWAVSIQNEPELGGPSQYTPESPAQYRAIWNAVEPAIHAIDPNIIAVFDDGCPWSEAFIKSAWTTTAPKGVGAIAYHPYASNGGLNAMPEFSAWAATQHVPLWGSEYVDWADPPADFQKALSMSPNVQLVSYYVWIHPGPFGFTPQPFHPPVLTPIPATNAAPSTAVLPKPAGLIGAASVAPPQLGKPAVKVTPHAQTKETKHRRILNRFRVLPDPPLGASHAYLCPAPYERVEDIISIFHWNGKRWILVKRWHSKPYLIGGFNPRHCRGVKWAQMVVERSTRSSG
jgi:hypothetical protein